MGVHIEDNKFVIITENKTFHFDLPRGVDNNLKHEIDSIIKHNKFLAEHTIKNKIGWLLFKYKYGRYSGTLKTVKQVNHTNLIF